MVPDAANNTGNSTGSIESGIPVADSNELAAFGMELSSDGLDEIAELLLKLARPKKKQTNVEQTKAKD